MTKQNAQISPARGRGRPPTLSEDEVREIRNSRSLTVTELAGLYGISKAQVSRIRSGISRSELCNNERDTL